MAVIDVSTATLEQQVLHATIGALELFGILLGDRLGHDLARPVEVLAAARAAFVPDGAWLVADEAVASSFTAPATSWNA